MANLPQTLKQIIVYSHIKQRKAAKSDKSDQKSFLESFYFSFLFLFFIVGGSNGP